ncbi:MAG TPA: MFS transporter [Gaiellaceae bacterium]
MAGEGLRKAGQAVSRQTVRVIGGVERTRLVVVLACVLALNGADTATVGASARQLRHALHISNTDIGLLVSVTALVGALASVPFGMLADRVRRTWTLGIAIVFWGATMLWCATADTFHQLLVARLALGAVTAAAGPIVASLVGDAFEPNERGRIYGYILSGELVGAGLGFGVSGNIATLSWRAAFVVLALPAFALAWFVFKLKEPARGEHVQSERLTDAQQLAREQGVEPERELVLERRRIGLVDAIRYVISVRTNLVLIGASACGYYFIAGVQTFGLEFAEQQYGVSQIIATSLLLAAGFGAALGSISGGMLSDFFLSHGRLQSRIVIAASAATASVIFFAPAVFTRAASTAVIALVAAVFVLSAQNPPLDAARLDIMPPFLWGRAESVRTLVRAIAVAIAPVLFGAVSDHVFGGGRSGLQWTFAIMLVPLFASAVLLIKALPTYPRDVATAAASANAR